MEENEKSQSEGLPPPDSDQWNPRPELREDAPAPKDPNTTPTAELVADYEALLAEIKVRKVSYDDEMQLLDATRTEATKNYEIAVRGASVEAAKLLVVISKRLGMPLNGAQRPGQPSPTPCNVCGQIFKNGLGMHMQMHARRGEIPGKLHQPKAVKQEFKQSMSADTCRALLVALRKHQPISSQQFGERLGRKSVSSLMTALKERGLAINSDVNHTWSLTAKGVAFLS